MTDDKDGADGAGGVDGAGPGGEPGADAPSGADVADASGAPSGADASGATNGADASGATSAASGAGGELPIGVAAAWGLLTRPAKGPKPALSIERIIAAGVRVASTDGLAAVSMTKVAAEVGATAMALYRYVGNKDELLSLMVDAGLGPPPQVPRPGQSWRAGLEEWAWASNAAFRRHPWALRVPVSGIPMLPNQLSWMDRGLRCLDGCGLDADRRLSVILLISSLVRIYASLELDLATTIAATGKTPDELMLGVGRQFAELVTSERFPALSAALDTGVLDQADPVDKELAFGLERALDGIEMLIAGRRPEAST